MEPIALESLRELKALFEWVREREGERTRTVLVGVGQSIHTIPTGVRWT